ncbi:UNVERIFIED_CONTAM: hypothetical protein Slati_2953900 [Sesamum latifolium]|uniref:Retrotransposon Copia-like N-terminal domain-containing protein n=1 Tax=Sesamum latifolium TaxID=2727402 RepID=A0AAW2VET5_9LAMI
MASSSSMVPDVPIAGNTAGIETGNYGMMMILAPLNGNNWLSWSRSLQIALEGRDRLDFSDGVCAKPDEGSAELIHWRITNSMTGHTKENCFKLHEAPDWYKDLTDQQRRNGNGGRAYVATEDVGNSVAQSLDLPATIEGNLVADLMKALKIIQNKMSPDPMRFHFAQGDEMEGMTLANTLSSSFVGSWIVDTGATNHMCGDATLFHSLNTLKSPLIITLLQQ